MEGSEEGTRKLVVSGGNGAIDLEVADHALDVISLAIDATVPGDGVGPMRAWRDDGADAALMQRGANGIGVVALVGEHVAGPRLGARGHGFERRAVRRLAGREVEDERDASGITETMNFTGEPAPRAAKSLFASPPFAPAAETWPRTVVESMLWRALSAIASASREAAASQMPAWLQRRKRWYTVIHLPYFSGTSRQGAPVRRRHRMPFTMVRLSCAGRFFRPRSAGKRSLSSRHSASLRSPRLNDPSSPRGIFESDGDSRVNHFVNRA